MKRKSVGILIIITAVLFMGVGAYAHATWLSFDSDVAVSENNVDEIMNILRQVNSDKLTAEEALEELQGIDHEGLKRRIKDLERELENKVTELDNKQDEVDQKNAEINDKNKVIESKDREIQELSEYVRHLENEVIKANNAVDGLNTKTNNAVDEARQYIN